MKTLYTISVINLILCVIAGDMPAALFAGLFVVFFGSALEEKEPQV